MLFLVWQSSDDASLNAIEALRREAQRSMGSQNVTCVQDFFTHEASSDLYTGLLYYEGTRCMQGCSCMTNLSMRQLILYALS